MEGFEELLGVNFFNAIFTLANTLTLFFVFVKFLYKPIMNIIQSRQKEIEDLYSEAADAKANAVAMEQKYEQKLSAAQETSQQMMADALARSRAKEEEILHQAREEAARLMNKASADIAQEKKKALNDAKNEISGIALAIAEKVVSRELNPDDHAKLVEDFIDSLEDAT